MKKVRKLAHCLLISSLLSMPVMAQEWRSQLDAPTPPLLEENYDSVLNPDEVGFMRENGTPIYRSVVQDGIMVTVEYALFDQHSTRLLISAQKLNGEAFETGLEIELKGIELIKPKKLETQVKPTDKAHTTGITMHKQSRAVWYVSITDEQVKDKVYYIYQGDDYDSYTSYRDFEIGEGKEWKEVSYNFTTDLQTILETQKSSNGQNISEEGFLVAQGLDIEIVEGLEEVVIQSMGFVDNQLHIGLGQDKDSKYHIACYDQDGNPVQMKVYPQKSHLLENGTYANEDYHVFDLASVEELKNCTFKLEGKEIVTSWDETLKIPVVSQFTPEVNVIQVNKLLDDIGSKEAYLTDVQLGTMTVTLSLEATEDILIPQYSPSSEIFNIIEQGGFEDLVVDVRYKDGKQIQLREVGTFEYSEGQLKLVYVLEDYITEDIAWIKIGEDLIYATEVIWSVDK